MVKTCGEEANDMYISQTLEVHLHLHLNCEDVETPSLVLFPKSLILCDFILVFLFQHRVNPNIFPKRPF